MDASPRKQNFQLIPHIVVYAALIVARQSCAVTEEARMQERGKVTAIIPVSDDAPKLLLKQVNSTNKDEAGAARRLRFFFLYGENAHGELAS